MQTINNYFLKKATVAYFLSLLACCLIYYNNWMDWYWILSGIIEVTLFFHFSTNLDISWRKFAEKSFEQCLFYSTIIIRLIWVIGFYMFTMSVWGTPWEQPIGISMDSVGYFNEALWLRDMMLNKDISPYLVYISGRLDDAGYPMFLGLLSFVTKESVLLTRLPNILFDACTVVLTYRIAQRNFGEKVARLASLFVLLMPILIFFSGTTMKESLMLMLATWALERGDYTLRNQSILSPSLLIFILLTSSLLLFRTALAWVIMLSFFSALLFSSKRVMPVPRRILIGLVLVVGGLLFMRGAISNQGSELYEQMESTGANFEFRATREGGNALVKNMNKAMLAPLIFTLPFPTMVSIEGQYIQQLLNGGYYLKNALSFFVLFALITIFRRKSWGGSVMTIAYLIGYLIALSFSSFAHSGRFHIPVIPVEMIFAALGINLIRNKRQASFFDYFLVIEFLIVLAWNGFKLKGRGL